MDKYNATGRTKKVIDIILGLLFIALLGYSFTGAPFHEVAGIVFIVMTIIHNIINIKWYKTIRKGVYSRKRKIAIAVNFALIADMVSILLTGIINSRYLFHTGIHITEIGQIHAVLALSGFVLIAFHVMFHAFGRVQKKYRVLPVTLAILISLLAVLMDAWLLPYAKRHFLTVEIDQGMVISGESVDFGGRKVLTVYFTRVGNTDFADDVVFLVFPLWWNTIPKPVEAFLNRYDFSGKSVIPVVTHGGSGAGRSIEDIKEACGGTVVEKPLEIYCGDIPYCREHVTEWLKGL